ncbi:MAG: 5'/3'-nucleotidase SurE, partial [Rhodanobacteraceae bacterium]
MASIEEQSREPSHRIRDVGDHVEPVMRPPADQNVENEVNRRDGCSFGDNDATVSNPHRECRMRVLISNDDGVDAPGIEVLAHRLAEVGEVTVVAPDRDRSGASNSLTLDQPIRV